MESELDKRRQVFRADIRKDYIETYQRKIRMEHLHRQQHLKQKKSKLSYPPIEHTQPLDTFIYTLQPLIFSSPNQICTVHCFESLMEVMETISKLEKSSIKNFVKNWKKKEKIYQLVYRVIEKVLDGDNSRVFRVIDQIFYLLQYPYMMPLWEKVSLLTDERVKEYSISKFKDLLSQNQQIFDEDFIVDVTSNFIINGPEISFQDCLQLLHFLGQEESQIKKSLNKVNKIAFILRTLIKGSAGNTQLIRLIQEGYQNMVIIIICSLYFSTKFECTDTVPLEIITKINISKLISEIFKCNGEAGIFLYSLSPSSPMTSLLSSLQVSCSIKEKYKILVCQNHAKLIKNILKTLSVVMNTKADGHLKITNDFIVENGLYLMGEILQTVQLHKRMQEFDEKGEIQWKIQIMNIICEIDPSFLSFSDCSKYFSILIKLISSFSNPYNPNLLEKALKLMKNILLKAYVRATEPLLFGQLSSKVRDDPHTTRLLEWLGERGGMGGTMGRDILCICENAKEYLNRVQSN